MSRRRAWIVLAILITLSAALSAQTPMPREAGPERRVSFFSGDWTFTGKMEDAAFGPDQPNNRITEHCEMVGDFFVACRYEIKGSASSLKGLGIFGYDERLRAYSFTSYDSTGVVARWSAQVKGDTWSLVSASAKERTTWKEMSPTSYHITVEALQADGRWAAAMIGTYQK